MSIRTMVFCNWKVAEDSHRVHGSDLGYDGLLLRTTPKPRLLCRQPIFGFLH